jgi:serine/threonine protein kinase
VSEELLKRGHKLGPYELRELIGQGGMGQVYRAWDEVLNRDVAVKILTLHEEEMLKRFAREAAAVGRLENHHVVEIHDLCVDGPHPYIVMEYLRGESLHTRLKRGPLGVEESVEVILGVCCAVNACHRVGIVHRDLKPGNVFLSQTVEYGMVVKVLDFGVAKPVELALDEDVTGPGKVVGTPRYLAPENVRGGPADQLSDQYQIGLLLYVCLTGKPPFHGKKENELARAILTADYPTLREQRADVSVGLDEVVMRAMHAERALRFPSVLELARALVPHVSEQNRTQWQQVFDSCEEAPPSPEDVDLSGSVTKVDSVATGQDTTLLVAAEQVAALAKNSVVTEPTVTQGEPSQEPSAKSTVILQPPAPVARIARSQQLVESATRIDSGCSESMYVAPQGQKEPAPHRRFRVSRRGLMVVMLAAAGIGSLIALLVTREGSDAAVSRWSSMVLPGADAGMPAGLTDARDAGKDAQAASGASVEMIRPANTGDGAKRVPTQDSGKKRRPKKIPRVDFTTEGSPILD